MIYIFYPYITFIGLTVFNYKPYSRIKAKKDTLYNNFTFLYFHHILRMPIPKPRFYTIIFPFHMPPVGSCL